MKFIRVRDNNMIDSNPIFPFPMEYDQNIFGLTSNLEQVIIFSNLDDGGIKIRIND